jgi:hypothetical protein
MAPTKKELSGPQWVARFPDLGTTASLADGFREGCEAFIAAIRAADATVTVDSIRRPAERAYLMHFAWRISKQTINPQNVSAKPGVDIEWTHREPSGAVDLAASRAAAAAMVKGYNIAFQPALLSRHTQGKAIDMTIGWRGNLTIAKRDGTQATITSGPRNGFNLGLRLVGKSYGLTKHPTDPPHWSTDGK